MENLLTVSEAVTRAALERRESRGAHTRDDYPGKDSDWGTVNLVITKGEDGAMRLRRKRVPPLRGDLKAIIEEIG